MCDADGELFIKPCTQAEVDFYESAAQQHPDFAAIMPTYIGTLALTETTDEAQIHAQIPSLVEQADIPAHLKEEIQSHLHLEDREVIPAPKQPVTKKVKTTKEGSSDAKTWVPSKKLATDRAVVLENASFGYKRPNILDAKLGLRLWADNAPQQKKDRFDKIAAETTHKNFGFRVAGMRAYKGATDEEELDEEDYRVFDKDWGRLTVNDGNITDSLRRFIFNEAAGIDEDLGRQVATRFAKDLRHVQRVLESEESRMFSASLLFVFEGDGEALRAALAEEKALFEARAQEAKAQAEEVEAAQIHVKRGATRDVCAANLRVDSGIGMSEEEMQEERFGGSGSGGGDDGNVLTIELNEADLDDEDEEQDLPDIHALKLIDFAHAEWTPGQGPDENVLKGVRSLAELFEEMAR